MSFQFSQYTPFFHLTVLSIDVSLSNPSQNFSNSRIKVLSWMNTNEGGNSFWTCSGFNISFTWVLNQSQFNGLLSKYMACTIMACAASMRTVSDVFDKKIFIVWLTNWTQARAKLVYRRQKKLRKLNLEKLCTLKKVKNLIFTEDHIWKSNSFV